MQGINFIVDNNNQKVAVVIDLAQHAEVWEDFYDVLLAQERKNEPRESLEFVEKLLLVPNNKS